MRFGVTTLPGGERGHFRAILLTFAANGLQAGAYTVLLADLAGALGLSFGTLGVALAALSAAAIPGVIASGRIADRLGRRLVLVVGSASVGLFYLLLATVDGYSLLLTTCVFGGLAFGFFDMVPNSLGGDYERQHGRRVMPLMYAGKDGAGAVGAVAGGAALWAGASFRVVYAAVGALLLLLAVAALRLPLPCHITDRGVGVRSHERPRRPWLVEGVLLAASFVGLASLADAAVSGYSSIYLRDVLGSGVLLGGFGIAAFQLARMLGQLGNAAAIGRLGERSVLVAAGGGTAAGIAVLVATRTPAVGVAGLLVLGIFESPIEPVSYSLAARSSPGRTGRAVSVVWRAFYVAFLVGPLLVGALADLTSLRAALSLFVLTSLIIAGLSYWRLR